MSEKISVRQICFIMLIYTAVSKFITYPTQLSYASGRDLLFSAALNFLLQGVIIWAVSYLCSRTDKTFFSLVEDTLGTVTARVVYGFFALFFMVGTLLPMLEQKVYVHAIFYDMLPSLLVFAPVFFFTVYAASRNFKNIGRCADICLPIFLIAMLFILVMSLHELQWDNFLPMLKAPQKVLKSSLSNAHRFSEPAFLLMFMGHFKYNRGDSAKITLSYIGGALFVMAVLTAFYGVYGDMAESRSFAIAKISLFFPAIDLIGRIDLLALYILEIAMLFALVLNMQLAVHCIEMCTGYKNKAVLSVAVNAVFIVLIIVLDNGFSAVNNIWSRWMWIVFLIFANLLPLSAWLMRRKNG